MAKIPFALDPHGNEIHISEADERNPRGYYTCPDCGGPLQTRIGATYQHCFAHYPGVLDERDCSLGTPDAIRKLTEEKRTSERERTYDQHIIPIGIRIQYGIVQLIGILPTLEWEDLDQNTSPDEALQDLSIAGTHIEGSLEGNNFHPNELEATVTLEQGAQEYSLYIQTNDNPSLEKLTGEWKAEGIKPGDVFVGDQTRAHRVSGQVKASAGDWVGIVTDDDPNDSRDEVEVYQMGDYYIVGFQYHDEQDILSDYLGEEMVRRERFSADLVLPPRSTPNSEAPQAIMTDEEILVGITPAPETNPEFEIVPFPRDAGDVDQLDALGEGVVRFWGQPFTGSESLQVTVHRPNTDEHRLLQFEPTETVNYPHWESEPRLSLIVKAQNETYELNPVMGPTELTLPQTVDADEFVNQLEMTSPENYRFDVLLELDSSSNHSTVRRQNKTLAEVQPLIKEALREGSKLLQFQLDGLPNITISFEARSPGPDSATKPDPTETMHTEKLPDKMVKDQLREMVPLPDKPRWEIVREIYNIPTGTSHPTLHYRAKKQIIQLLNDIHSEKQEDDTT